ncbi:MAG: succinate dehydrogenase iron-sulfur subunit [Actinomycetota bacterium]|nr:succinate dehydrogenase iron-sulfur subunit [Actinomycetota bacterium]
MEVTLRIQRYNPEVDEKLHFEEYEVPAEPSDRILDLLHWVKWNLDGTLTFRRSCAHGICGSDAMVVNGRNRLACAVLVKDLPDYVTIEPLRGFNVLKDLVVDMEPFFASYRRVLPWLISEQQPPLRERRQTPKERERYDDTTKCILCAACTGGCPVYWPNDEFIGPAAIVNAHRFIFDSRDDGARERLSILDDTNGVWRCRTTFNCTAACPRGIKVTKAIQEVKRELIFSRF